MITPYILLCVGALIFGSSCQNKKTPPDKISMQEQENSLDSPPKEEKKSPRPKVVQIQR